LSYLTKLDFNILKIDRSFITDIDKSPHNFTIVKSTIEIAKILSFDIVAEGVETKEQLDIIKQLGCHQYQGYYLSKAMPADKVIDFVNDINKKV
jgi:EAL domain-containing protein (putative c-di-GMP-specific phosphodiesterase class I)